MQQGRVLALESRRQCTRIRYQLPNNHFSGPCPLQSSDDDIYVVDRSLAAIFPTSPSLSLSPYIHLTLSYHPSCCLPSTYESESVANPNLAFSSCKKTSCSLALFSRSKKIQIPNALTTLKANKK